MIKISKILEIDVDLEKKEIKDAKKFIQDIEELQNKINTNDWVGGLSINYKDVLLVKQALFYAKSHKKKYITSIEKLLEHHSG